MCIFGYVNTINGQLLVQGIVYRTSLDLESSSAVTSQVW
jgi:hypothetical protein